MSTTPNIALSEEQLKRSTFLLSMVLADEMTLYVKLRKCHWNVTGNSFMELHKLFETQYGELEKTIDEVAERINQLGSKTIGTMKEFLELTRLQEGAGQYPNQTNMMEELLADNETLITEIRKDIAICADETNDAGSADLLTKILQQHEMMAWVLRRYLS